ncbi:MAG: hypothetical protein AB8G05_26990 [Oligoflexales bacterium]
MFECLIEEFNYRAFIDKVVGDLSERSLHEHSASVMNNQPNGVRFCELGLLRSSFGSDFVKAIGSQRVKDWYALTFCLRFHITWMNFFFSKIQAEGLLTDIAGTKQFFLLTKLKELEYSTYLNQKLESLAPVYLPILGFSAVGVHAKLQRVGYCRAFDSEMLTECGEKADTVFCKLHANETWWLKSPKKQRTRQATMYQFYSDPENFYLYNEADLDNFIGKFWSRMRAYKNVENEDVKKSLDVFGLQDQQELFNLGAIGLRRMFLQKSMECHPDMGGEQEQFIALRGSYEVLRFLFS